MKVFSSQGSSRTGLLRLLACALDGGAILAYAGCLAGAALGTRRLLSVEVGLPTTLRGRLIGHGIAFFTLTLPVVLLHALLESGERGATIGKRVAGLRVSDEGGGRLSLRQALLRSAVKFLPWEIAHTALWHTPGWPADPRPGAPQVLGYATSQLLAAGFVASLFVSSGRTPADWLARTKVTRARRCRAREDGARNVIDRREARNI